jgi:hypothetical protein
MMKNQKEPESSTQPNLFNDDRFQPLFPAVILFDEIPTDISLPELILLDSKIENSSLSLTFKNCNDGYIDIYLLNNGKKVDLFYHCNKRVVVFNNIRFADLNNYEVFYLKGKRKSIITKIQLNREKLGSYHDYAN